MGANNIYVEKGYKNRQDYLKNLADDYGADYGTVCEIAEILGENEDFDGLISTLEDEYFD